MRWRTILLFLGVAAIAYFLYLREERGGLQAGMTAPDFRLPSRRGSVSLSDFRGKVVLLNFWATWCPPCVYEMPSLENLKRQMEGKDFQLLAVSLDEEGWGAVDRFLQKNPLSITILLDPRGDVPSAYGTDILPESYLIDKNGIVVKKYTGPREWTDPKIVSEILKYVEGS